MQIKKLKKTIYINLFILLSLCITLSVIFFYVYGISQDSSKEIKQIKSETSALNRKTREVESQIKDARKYKKFWNAISDNKKNTKPIKSEDLNNILSEIALRYDVNNPIIKLVLPIEINKGIFRRKTIKSFYANGTLTFQAYDDSKALSFIKDFSSEISGNLVIKSIRIKKELDYTNQDLVEISKGENKGHLKVNLDFTWYSYRDKEIEEKKKLQNNNKKL